MDLVKTRTGDFTGTQQINTGAQQINTGPLMWKLWWNCLTIE
jgi:hypothetical protein